MLDINNLTLGEISLIEDLSGLAIASIADSDSPKGKALAALAMVAKRRSGEPTFTFNQACALTLQDANALLGVGAETSDEEADAEEKDES
jgi:hypothetical protein